MTIDITPEAIEHLCAIHEGYEQHGTVATLRALSAALKDKQDDTYLRGFNAGQLSLKNAGEFTVIDSPELADLRAALTASQAETAANYAIATHALDMWAKNLRDDGFSNAAPVLIEKCSDIIRALTPADSKAALDRMITDARADGMREPLAAAMQLPEVRALADIAFEVKTQLENGAYEGVNFYTGETRKYYGVRLETWSALCAALAPFTKGGE